MGVKVTFLRDTEEGGNGARRGGARASRRSRSCQRPRIRTEGDQTYAFVVVSGGIVDRRAVKTRRHRRRSRRSAGRAARRRRVVVSPPAALATGAMVTEKQ